MSSASRPLVSPFAVFVAASVFALAFAVVTQHAWEDYWITYRASKNLAIGNGLVFNPGERLHTFTSPLGTLLPAVCSLATFNTSDTVALWLFRAMSIGAFAGGATLIYVTSRRLRQHRLASVLLVAWLITDGKSLDFTINGMEVGFLLLFLAYTIWAIFAAGEKRALHLGAAWAGLMWTRPDGFVYIGALALGVILFNKQALSGTTRKQWLKIFVVAAGICALLYLPWLVFAWSYYGTPVPHTIIAKGNAAGIPTLGSIVASVLKLPLTSLSEATAMTSIYAPSYYQMEAWPQWVLNFGLTLAWIGAYLWLLPFVRWEARLLSFGSWAWIGYLACRPLWLVCPWYVPGAAWLSLGALGFLLAQCLGEEGERARATSSMSKLLRGASVAVALAILGVTGWTTFQAGRQLKQQQALTNGGLRREIGEWLKSQASPGDRVFLEPLGYIGFYSQLKTLDYPGMSSPEVVKTIKEERTTNWLRIIARLKPEWVVLRPAEVTFYAQRDPGLLSSVITKQYQIARVFDVSSEVAQLDIYGRGYLGVDSAFLVFRRNGNP